MVNMLSREDKDDGALGCAIMMVGGAVIVAGTIVADILGIRDERWGIAIVVVLLLMWWLERGGANPRNSKQ